MFKNLDVMTKALNASWKRNEVIAHNIANANTPNFKKSNVMFEEILHNNLNKRNIGANITHEKHIKIGASNIEDIEHKVITANNYSNRRDGNNVDVDVEMAELAKNNITFNTLSTQLNNEFRRLKLVISEGRR
ncbi:MAG: flagellar basal body rod protein FlgB [Clostridiaceae bacterium]|nr:flagellar basal body rod protein FlgB [Clostridiaceae bacterium]